MNLLISLLIAVLFVAFMWRAPKSLDTTARIAIRGWGVALGLVYLVAALVFSWWAALIALACLFMLVVIASILS